MTSLLPVCISLCFFIITSGVPVPECCSLISGSCGTACNQISLVSIALDPHERQFRLWTLNQYCDKELTKFWQCFNQSLSDIQQGEEWTGRPCCKLPQSQTCRYACLKAQVKSDLFQECRRSDEIGFFSCVEQLEVGEKCCANAQTVECHQACQQVFATKQTPNRKIRNAVTQSCSFHSPKVVRCVQDYIRMTPSNNPQRNLHCCDKSPNENCRTSCHHALRTKKTDQDIADALEAACGPPLPHDKMWQCFLQHADPPNSQSSSVSSINRMGMDSAKLQCCWKAVSINCRKLCFKTFSNEWANSWDTFDKKCQSDINEAELVACLTEVDEPCELGCEGLTYCTNFNDRPTELFQSCSSTADRAAKKDVGLWNSRYITMPSMQIPVVDISTCDPNTWKAVACTLQLKPCRPHRPIATICKSDCIAILTKCLDYDRLSPDVTPESICNVLAPAANDSSCISLKSYLVKSPEAVNALQVTHPCHPNPCNVSEVCVVTRYCSHGQICLPYQCMPGCRMGDISSLVVPQESLVSIPLLSLTLGCQKVCKCSQRLQVEDCFNGPCIERLHCWDGSKRIEHGQVFDAGCNKCVCFSGEVTCTKLACSPSNEFISFTGLPCNCPTHYVPVCGANGRTYPSACLAKCANLQEIQIDFGGSCSTLNPCSSNPCLPNQRCEPKRSVCLSINKRQCKQYVCVNLNNDCALQTKKPVCDVKGRQYENICYLIKNNSILAYWGPCLKQCRDIGIVCGHNGEVYESECAARSDRISVDYQGPCTAVGSVNDDINVVRCARVECPPLKVSNCVRITPPGSCCPICGSGLEVLYSPKHADFLLSPLLDQIRVQEIGDHLVRYVQSAECDLFTYLSISGSLIVLVLPITPTPTWLQTQVCATEAEKLSLLMKHGSPLLTTDVLLSHLKSAQILHTPGSSSISNFVCNYFLQAALLVFILSFNIIYISRT